MVVTTATMTMLMMTMVLLTMLMMSTSQAIYDYHTGECMATMAGHSELVTGLAFSNDCRHLISVSGKVDHRGNFDHSDNYSIDNHDGSASHSDVFRRLLCLCLEIAWRDGRHHAGLVMMIRLAIIMVMRMMSDDGVDIFEALTFSPNTSSGSTSGESKQERQQNLHHKS